MKKRNLILAILVVIFIATFTVGAIQSHTKMKSEKHLNIVITNFLAYDYIWNESQETLCYPEYIEISFDKKTDFFIKIPLNSDSYSMYYSTRYDKPNFFVETSYSIKDSTHTEFSNIFSICKRLQYDTCFLKTSTETVRIEIIRIYRDGTIEAKDTSGEWHTKILSKDFILA